MSYFFLTWLKTGTFGVPKVTVLDTGAELFKTHKTGTFGVPKVTVLDTGAELFKTHKTGMFMAKPGLMYPYIVYVS